MPDTKKDTIYVDVDDEITAIIDKVRSSNAKIVALVLPKRAATLQSVVNLKLLKRSAQTAKKNIVLITSEPNIVALAGGVGLHVAKTLQSKPELPDMKIVDNSGDDAAEEVVEAAAPAAATAAEDTIELDNDKVEDIDLDDKKSVKDDGGKKKRIKIPDFDKFRLLLFGGIALVLLLIVGSVFAFVILPKANITITTDSSSQTIDLNVIAKKDATSVDQNTKTVPALSKELKKTESLKVPATGQRDDGTKATGVVTLTNCTKDTEPVSIPAGTILTTNGLSFVTDAAVQIDPSDFTGGITCKGNSFKNVNVTAQNAGGQYNLSANRTFVVSGFGSVSGKNGAALSGGTSKLTQVVSQADLDNAKQKILDSIGAAASADLRDQFESDGALGLTDTLKAGDPAVTSTPKVNEAATDVTVQIIVTYTETGVKKDDLKQLIETEANKHIDSSKQTIQDNGIDKAVIHLTDNKAPASVNFDIQTIVVAGPQLDSEGIKKEIAGKKKGDTTRIIQGRPGIKDVDIKYSPFWVFSTPKNIKHITITFKQPDANP